MPQSSRVIVTREASTRHRATSDGDAAVRRKRNGRVAVAVLRIGQRLLGLAPASKPFRARTFDQDIGVANAEMIATLIEVELLPGDWGGHRRALASAGRKRHHGRRPALIAQPVKEDAALTLDF